MNRKFFRILPNVFIVLLTLILIGAFVIPMILFWITPENPLRVLAITPKDKKAASYEWILKHFKIAGFEEADKPDLLILADLKNLAPDFFSRVEHNVIVGEKLYSEEAATEEKKQELQHFFRSDYTGYSGKSYEDLGDRLSIPKENIKLYERLNQKKWNFSGRGVIISSEENIIVLEKGIDYTGALSIKENDRSMPFTGRFEIIKTTGTVEAEFQLSLSKKGEEKLGYYGLSSSFPAVVRIDSLLYRGYYFSGDFSNTAMTMPYNMKSVEVYLANRGIYERDSNEEVFWKWFFNKFREITNVAADYPSTYTATKFALQPTGIFRVTDLKIEKKKDGTYQEYFINGVNLGAALPGKTFTEFPEQVGVYREWLAEMSDLNINTLRVYTLLPPAFYKALYEHNANNKQPIYLLQEIWPEEKPAEGNYLGEEYNAAYRKEIERVCAAIHGDVNIPPREFRAFGAYSYDVSPYLVGYLVGRELEPDEVLTTDRLNPTYEHKGEYIFSEKEASPTEAWLAASCDYTLAYEKKFYENKPLVAIVNWPTLDPISHISEWNASGEKSLQGNDKVVVDINHIGTYPEKISGFFGAYHIYPNYPDFMNNDPAYREYRDSQGRFLYGGYLKEFMSYQRKYPAIVAEYGLSTSLYTAHYNPDGYNHGGVSESSQTAGIIRMNKAIAKEGYSGALVFEWFDEWAKKTWTTEPYMIPYENHMRWHNLIDPEQNYGLVANGSVPPRMEEIKTNSDNKIINKVEAGICASYIQLQFSFAEGYQDEKPLKLLISTHDGEGEPTTWEFYLDLPSKKLLVNPGYNWIKGSYHSVSATPSEFVELIQETNAEALTMEEKKIPAIRVNLSELKYGSFIDNLTTIEYTKNRVSIRLPYGILGISDPSSGMVLEDFTARIPTGINQIRAVKTDKMSFKIIQAEGGDVGFEVPFTGWDTPEYNTYRKAGFGILADYFNTLNK